MKSFLRNYVNALLALFAFLLLAAIVGCFVWGVGDIVSAFNQANSSQTKPASTPSFNLEGAAGLDYRGLTPAAVATSAPTGQ